MMNQEDILKKTGQILSELNEQYQYLAKNPSELNELELELFLANSTFLSDHVRIIQKLNGGVKRNILPEHTATDEANDIAITMAPPIELNTVKPIIEDEIFKFDDEPSSFEFILSDHSSSDQFEFEEKSVDEIFDRPLSKEEEQIIAQKQKLREKELHELESTRLEEDEIGPEPFLVSEPVHEEDETTQVFEEELEDVEEEPEEGTEAIDVEPAILENKPVIIENEPIIIEEEPVAIKQEYVPVVEEKEVSSYIAPEEAPAHQIIEPVVSIPIEKVATPIQENPILFPEVKQAEPVAAVKTEPITKPTLNDILASSTNNNAHNGSGRQEIKDLKQSISLNDKLRYIKDLFNGYNLAYAEVIDLLNKMPDFKTADAFLQNNYAVKNDWSAKQDTADQFYELLHRRFPVK